MEKMDLGKLAETLAQMQEMIDGIKSMLPDAATSAADEENTIDEQTTDAEEQADDPAEMKPADDGKDLKKAAIMRIMAKA